MSPRLHQPAVGETRVDGVAGGASCLPGSKETSVGLDVFKMLPLTLTRPPTGPRQDIQ